MMSPLRGYYDVAPMELVITLGRGVAEGGGAMRRVTTMSPLRGYYDVAPMELVIPLGRGVAEGGGANRPAGALTPSYAEVQI